MPCHACGVMIEPDEVDVVEAVAMVHIPTMDPAGSADPIEKPGYVFHANHFPEGDPNWRRR